MTPDDRWLAAVWPFVGGQLPSAPATVLEVGCGPLGGVVPALLDGGYDAVGVDPEAPEGPTTSRSSWCNAAVVPAGPAPSTRTFITGRLCAGRLRMAITQTGELESWACDRD
jgi:hypothetical protein